MARRERIYAFCLLVLSTSCATDRGGVGPCNPRVAGSCLDAGPADGATDAGPDAAAPLPDTGH